MLAKVLRAYEISDPLWTSLRFTFSKVFFNLNGFALPKLRRSVKLQELRFLSNQFNENNLNII